MLLVACGQNPDLDTAVQAPDVQEAKAPNVVLILLDDLDTSDVGAYGGTAIRTERLDRFATEAVRFTNFYATPFCSPTRAAILSGLYPQRFNIRRALGPSTRLAMPDELVLLPELLVAAGYNTSHFGKWHLGHVRPIESGFQRSVVPHAKDTYFSPTLQIDDRRKVERGGHQTRVITEYAVRELREAKRAGRPFFLNLWYNAPHSPPVPPRDWAEQYPKTHLGRYYALVSTVDEQIGVVLDTLEATGLAENTIVVIASDNGGTEVGVEDEASLRGFKGSVFEGGIRAPLMMRWPEHWKPRTEEAVVACQDLYPTLVAALGLGVPVLDGESFLPVLEGEDWSRSGPLLWETKFTKTRYQSAGEHLNNFAVRAGDLKLVVDENPTQAEARLFDLAADPLERNDLASERKADVAALLDVYWSWRETVARIQLRVAGAGLKRLELTESGRVILDPDTRFDVRSEGNLSFSARLRSAPEGPPGPALVVERPGAWELSLDAEGHPVLVLYDLGRQPHAVTSAARLTPGEAQDVAFCVYSFRDSGKLVRLSVGNEAQEAFLDGFVLHAGEGPPALGSRADGSRPFLGSIEDARFYAAFLLPTELERIRRERQ